MRVLACVLLVLGACHRAPRGAPPPPAPDAALADAAAVVDAAPPDAEWHPEAAVLGILGILGGGPWDRPCQVDSDCVTTTFEGCCRCCLCGPPSAETRKALHDSKLFCQVADCDMGHCTIGQADCPPCQPDRPAFCRQGVCVMH